MFSIVIHHTTMKVNFQSDSLCLKCLPSAG